MFLFQSTLTEAWQYRQASEEVYTTSRDDDIDVEFLPWTGTLTLDDKSFKKMKLYISQLYIHFFHIEEKLSHTMKKIKFVLLYFLTPITADYSTVRGSVYQGRREVARGLGNTSFSEGPYDVIIVKREKRCFTLYYTLSHSIRYLLHTYCYIMIVSDLLEQL